MDTKASSETGASASDLAPPQRRWQCLSAGTVVLIFSSVAAQAAPTVMDTSNCLSPTQRAERLRAEWHSSVTPGETDAGHQLAQWNNWNNWPNWGNWGNWYG